MYPVWQTWSYHTKIILLRFSWLNCFQLDSRIHLGDPMNSWIQWQESALIMVDKTCHTHQEAEHLLWLAFIQDIRQFQDLGAKISSIETLCLIIHHVVGWSQQTYCVFLQHKDHLKLKGKFIEPNHAMILSRRSIRCQGISDTRPRRVWTWIASSSHHLSQS